jgi:hypothetical protein
VVVVAEAIKNRLLLIELLQIILPPKIITAKDVYKTEGLKKIKKEQRKALRIV